MRHARRPEGPTEWVAIEAEGHKYAPPCEGDDELDMRTLCEKVFGD